MIYLIEGLKGQGYARGTHTYRGLVRARCSDPNARAPQGPCPVVETPVLCALYQVNWEILRVVSFRFALRPN